MTSLVGTWAARHRARRSLCHANGQADRRLFMGTGARSSVRALSADLPFMHVGAGRPACGNACSAGRPGAMMALEINTSRRGGCRAGAHRCRVGGVAARQGRRAADLTGRWPFASCYRPVTSRPVRAPLTRALPPFRLTLATPVPRMHPVVVGEQAERHRLRSACRRTHRGGELCSHGRGPRQASGRCRA